MEFDATVEEISIGGGKVTIRTKSGHVVELGEHHLQMYCRSKEKLDLKPVSVDFSRIRGCRSCGDKKDDASR